MTPTPDALDAMRETRRGDLAFLYSTPAYRRQLEHFGLADVGATLAEMARLNQWDDMRSQFTDQILNRIVPQGTYDGIPDVLSEWYAGLCTGVCLSIPAADTDDVQLKRLVKRCRHIPTLPGEPHVTDRGPNV